jgi:hypothetical protein
MRHTRTQDNQQSAEDCAHEDSGLWPSHTYRVQIEQLRGAVGERIFIAELHDTETQLGVRITDHAYELLAIAEFPQPNPERGLAPHMVILDDGRGLNLGRIARISRRAFDPAPADILYLDPRVQRSLLFRERRLSSSLLKARCRQSLGQVLGYPEEDAQRRLDAVDAPDAVDSGGESMKR